MKRKIIFSVVLIIVCFCSYGQDYIRITENVKIDGIEFFKGEIYPKPDSDHFKYLDTLLRIESKFYENFSDSGLYSLDSKSFKEGIFYQLNFREILTSGDTINLIDQFNQPVLNIIFKDSMLSVYSERRIGYRLLIPKHQTLAFGKIENNAKLKSENIEDNSQINMKLWQIIILSIVAILLSAFTTWIILKKKIFSKRYKVTRKYEEGSLGDFAAECGIKRRKLIRLNKNRLKPYLRIKERREKEQFKKTLIGLDLIIGYSTDVPDSYTDEVKSSDVQDIKIKQKSYPGVNSHLISLLNSIESNILVKLDTVSTDSEAQKKAVSLQKDIDQQNEKLVQCESTREMLIEEMDKLKQELNQTKQNKLQIEDESSFYRERVIFVEFLYPYAKIVLDFINSSQTGFNKALELYKKLSEEDERSSMIVAQLLLKFLSQIPSNIGNWEEILHEITEIKATSNLELIKSLKQIQSDEEKVNEFKRLLSREILEKYCSSILILFEELSKLSRFTNTKDGVILEFEYFYPDFNNQIQSKIKAIGLEINPIHLFENYQHYAAYTKLTNQTCSISYKNIKDLEKDAILEVVNYGFGGEDTKIILF